MISAHAAGTAGPGGWFTGLPLLAAAVMYGRGALSLSCRGDCWPWPRTAVAVGGLACLGAATLPPVARHDEIFSVHVAQHLLLGSLGPVLLALSAPVTLTLRVAGPTVRRTVLAVVRSRAARLATHPAIVILADLGALYVFYLTPLFGAAEEHPLLHAVVHLHMLVAGCLFAWYVVGVDPMPHRPSVMTRLLVLVAAAGGHDILAKLLYEHALPTTGGTPEQIRAGAQLMYYGGDAIEVLMVLVLLGGWYTRTGRALAHAARRAHDAASNQRIPPV